MRAGSRVRLVMLSEGAGSQEVIICCRRLSRLAGFMIAPRGHKLMACAAKTYRVFRRIKENSVMISSVLLQSAVMGIFSGACQSFVTSDTPVLLQFFLKSSTYNIRAGSTGEFIGN